jgi:hypothetical protein
VELKSLDGKRQKQMFGAVGFGMLPFISRLLSQR